MKMCEAAAARYAGLPSDTHFPRAARTCPGPYAFARCAVYCPITI